MASRGRPVIPAELKRQVLIEAGHCCAIPTCRHPDCDVHHIVPWEQCKKHEYENLIALCPNCHRRANQGKIDKKSLRRYKANLRFAIEKYSQFEMDVLFELFRAKPNKGLPFPTYLSLLIKRILDAGFIQIIEPEGIAASLRGFYNNGKFDFIKLTPDLLVITDKGREFVESLSIKEIGY